MNDKCLVCNLDVSEPKNYIVPNNDSRYDFSCQRCGDYSIESTFKSLLPDILRGDIRKIAALSHWIRTEHEAITKEPPDKRGFRKTIILDEELVNTIIKRQPPNPAEQANNIIRWIVENTEACGEFLKLTPGKHQSIMGSITQEEFLWVRDHLIESGIMEGNKFLDGTASIRLSFEGWQYYEELKRGAIDCRKAFMAMQYGDAILDKIVEETFKTAVKQTGFDLFKLADRPQAGLIDDRLRVEIQTSLFLIADLTHNNLGAYWEAGYAEGLGKPVIYTCEKNKFEKEPPHFDTNHHLTIIWQAENPQEAAEKLKATIRATLPGEARLIDE